MSLDERLLFVYYLKSNADVRKFMGKKDDDVIFPVQSGSNDLPEREIVQRTVALITWRSNITHINIS